MRLVAYRETSLGPPVIFLLTVLSTDVNILKFRIHVSRQYFFCGSFIYLCLSFPYCLVCVLQPCGHLFGKGWPLGSPVGETGAKWYTGLNDTARFFKR